MQTTQTNIASTSGNQHSFPSLRKSRCARQSFEQELNRVRNMSIEERVQEALGMANHFESFYAKQNEK